MEKDQGGKPDPVASYGLIMAFHWDDCGRTWLLPSY